MDSNILKIGNELSQEIKYIETKLEQIKNIKDNYTGKKSIDILNIYVTVFGDIKLREINTETIDKIINVIKKDYEEKLFLLKSDFILL